MRRRWSSRRPGGARPHSPGRPGHGAGTARRAGLAVPETIRTRDGALSANGLVVEAFVDSAPARPGDVARLAPALARFHRSSVGMPPRPGLLAVDALSRAPGDDDCAFALLPPALASTCRAALSRLGGRPQSAVHGDVTTANILRGRDGRLWLIDWDERRRDATAFDRVDHGHARNPIIERARLAREVLIFWQASPDYARRLGRRLIDRRPRENVF